MSKSAAAVRAVPDLPDDERPPPPPHLSDPMRAWWSETVRTYELEAHHLLLLGHACEAWDRAEEARVMVDGEGAVVRDRFGQHKQHPGVKIEIDNRAAFARLVRQLDLEGDPDPLYRRPS